MSKSLNLSLCFNQAIHFFIIIKIVFDMNSKWNKMSIVEMKKELYDWLIE